MKAAAAELRVILCTFPDRESGRRIARALVEERLVACAQLDGAAIESFYWWQGTVAQESEVRLIAKTREPLVAALRARIAELHPYRVPQVIDLAADANTAYMNWLRAECRPAAP